MVPLQTRSFVNRAQKWQNIQVGITLSYAIAAMPDLPQSVVPTLCTSDHIVNKAKANLILLSPEYQRKALVSHTGKAISKATLKMRLADAWSRPQHRHSCWKDIHSQQKLIQFYKSAHSPTRWLYNLAEHVTHASTWRPSYTNEIAKAVFSAHTATTNPSTSTSIWSSPTSPWQKSHRYQV